MAKPKRHGFPVVVHVMLMRKDDVFFLRRSATGFMDGYFCLPGGHQQPGESVSAAAWRECREETGAAPIDLEPRFVLPYISGAHQGLNFVFVAHRYAGEPRVEEPHLFDACCWAPALKPPMPVTPWLADALRLPDGHWYREFHWPGRKPAP